MEHGKNSDCRMGRSCRSAIFASRDRQLMVQLGTERFLAPEILFNPELIGQEYPGVHQVIVDSINRTDLDLRKALFSNIVLSGGSTLCTGQLLRSNVRYRANGRVWRPPIERGQETRLKGRQAENIRTARTESKLDSGYPRPSSLRAVLYLDRREYPGWFEHVQEGESSFGFLSAAHA